MSECEHGGDPLACPVAACNPRGQVVARDVGPPFDARYDGYCPARDCERDNIIEAGDRIRMVDGVSHHKECVG